MDPAQLEDLKRQSGAADQGQKGGEGDAKAKREQEEEMKHSMLSQLLLPAARERLSRIQLVRPQRADQITGLLARMAQSGQLRGRVSEDQLVDVLNQVEAMEQRGQGGASAGGPAESKIVFSRRKGNYSDDEDDFGLPSTSSTAAASKQADSDDEFDL